MSAPITTVSARPATKPAISSNAANALLQHWHLLSLDAPTVAVVWTMAFAQVSGVKLPMLAPFLLAIATWLLYVADRLLDTFRTSARNALQERHYFHRRHRAVFLWIAVPSLALLTWLVARYMDPAPRYEDMLLAVAAGLYLLLVHLPRTSHSAAVPQTARYSSKEAAVGMIFAAACIIPSWSRSGTAHAGLLATGSLFAALCWLNCVFIDAWESRPSSIISSRRLRTASLWLVVATFTVVILTVSGHQWPFAILCACILLSTAMLLRLDQQRSRLAPVQLRALADVALLTPIVMLLLWQIA